ncbi:Phosphatidylinositol N-acetylglucosaminyltransferase subunit C [Chionoecetes opilio]|uniref:Phosphatidylinositol N-acetylglucosaminyltransferase subunit C n=1 Tax=Chionoecetes opilio TaxID=41210 RepID=A0A8J5D1M4_CHIOP|nr:Phosphatidylinositol N-acetylglucosaminyltransferase subunit C [Chionoecetes opilio]
MEQSEWSRVLWKKQPFPDNYVGDSFLRVSKKRSFDTLDLLQSKPVSCLGLVVIFFGISEGDLNSAVTLALTATVGVAGYLLTRTQLTASVRDDAKVACFYGVLIACVSPVIKSLTGSVATDSINASTTFLLLLRLAVHDYGTEVAIVNPTVSHNVGLFASVCLASRLESDLDVFTLLTVAVALFTLFPSFRRDFQSQFGLRWCVVLAVVVVAVTGSGILLFASHLLLLFLVAMFVCQLFVPTLYVTLQGYKQ